MEAGVDGGPICGVPAQLDCRELVGVLLGDMSMSSWCSVKKIKVQSNLPYRSPLSSGRFETRPTNITIQFNSLQRSPISCVNCEIVF
jgi:hypothetical protein